MSRQQPDVGSSPLQNSCAKRGKAKVERIGSTTPLQQLWSKQLGEGERIREACSSFILLWIWIISAGPWSGMFTRAIGIRSAGGPPNTSQQPPKTPALRTSQPPHMRTFKGQLPRHPGSASRGPAPQSSRSTVAGPVWPGPNEVRTAFELTCRRRGFTLTSPRPALSAMRSGCEPSASVRGLALDGSDPSLTLRFTV